jgi:hypothetical protein
VASEGVVVDAVPLRILGAVLERFPDISLVINSDHGECFNHCGKQAFDGNWARTDAPLWHHSSGFCPEQFEVFAIEYGPGVRAGSVDSCLMDLPAYDQAQEAVLLRLQGFGYL